MNTCIEIRTLGTDLDSSVRTRLQGINHVPFDTAVWHSKFFAIVTLPVRAGENAYSCEAWLLHMRRVNGAYAPLGRHSFCCVRIGYVISQDEPLRVWMVNSLSNADREIGIMRGDYGKMASYAARRQEAIDSYREHASINTEDV